MQGVSVEENPESGAESRQATFSQLLDDLSSECPGLCPSVLNACPSIYVAYGPTHWPDAMSSKLAWVPFTRLYVRYMSLPHMLTKRLAFGPGPLSRLGRLVNGLEQLQLQQAGCKVGFLIWYACPSYLSH